MRHRNMIMWTARAVGGAMLLWQTAIISPSGNGSGFIFHQDGRTTIYNSQPDGHYQYYGGPGHSGLGYVNPQTGSGYDINTVPPSDSGSASGGYGWDQWE